MNLLQQIRKIFLRVLKYTLNPLTRRIARSSFGPFSIVQHVGRRSGKLYETPIIVAPTTDGFVIELTYGPDVDWHKNVLAAGGCTLVWHTKKYLISTIEQIDAKTGLSAFPMSQQLILLLTRRNHFEYWKYATIP